MTPRWLVALIVPLAASAQLRLAVFSDGVETAIGNVHDLGSIAANDSASIRIRARNAGTTAIAVTSIAANGAGFSIPNKPELPYTLAPSAFLEITVRFAPAAPASYSANLQVNSVSALLVARAVAAGSLSVSPAGPCRGPDSSNFIDFGRVQRKLTEACSFRLQNPYQIPVTVNTLTITGDGFNGPLGIRTPFILLAGELIVFQVQFSPPVSSIFTGALVIDQRTYSLGGIGFDPPLPRPTLEFTGTSASAQQRALRLRLPFPSPVDASGLVRLTFRSAVTNVPDDPAIVFVASNSRNAAFQIREGDTSARFGNQSEVVFQTGTTAGDIQFLIEVDGAPGGSSIDPNTAIIIPGSAVSIDAAQATRRVNDLDIQITGFDNTYSVGPLAFTFFDSAGRPIDPGVIRVDASSDFRLFFARALAGSSFVLRASFPVSGDATQVVGVDVEMTNVRGSTRTERITFK